MEKFKTHNYNESTYLNMSLANAFQHDTHIIKSLKYELDQHIYYYGNHFSHPVEKDKNLAEINALFNKNINLFYRNLRAIRKIKNWVAKANHRHDKKNIIFFGNYFTTNNWIKSFTKTTNYAASPTLWNKSNNQNSIENIIREQCLLLNQLMKVDFRILVNNCFIQALRELNCILEEYYSHDSIHAIALPFALPYFEQISLNIFKKLNKKTFLVVHGFPNKCAWPVDIIFDYLVFWGEESKKFYDKIIPSKTQILVSGHPNYHTPPLKNNLRFTFDNILVLTYSMAGAPNDNRPIYQNRGILLDFVYTIQNVLRHLGVKRARLRPHPSESTDWYSEFIDSSFFEIDTEPLPISLNKSTLVLGFVSTVFLESIYYGVNYTIFNPAGYKKIVHENYEYAQFSPFDGSNLKVPVAHNENDLMYILNNKISVNPSCIYDYIKFPFDSTVITKALESA